MFYIRYGVKITLYHSRQRSPISENLYYNKGFIFENFQKWKWFFRYRAALLQVHYKDKFIELEYFSYKEVPTKQKEIKRISNKLKGAKATATKNRNKMNRIEKNWNQIFPFDSHPDYLRAEKKVSDYEKKVIELENELASLQ